MIFFTRKTSTQPYEKWSINRHKSCRWLGASLLPVVLSLTSLAVVAPTASAQQYQPPTGDPPGGPRGSNGSREGCGRAYGIPLTALAPTQHVGQTTTTTPTFIWFIPATSPYRIDLSFYTFNDDQQRELLHQVEYVDSTSGLVKFTLPADEFNLSPGQVYQWQVSIACTPDGPSYDQSFISTLEVVAPPDSLTTALATAQTPAEKAEIYAEAGYWYDALREAMDASDNFNPDGFTGSLLHQLAETEGGLHGYYLTQIIEILNAPEF